MTTAGGARAKTGLTLQLLNYVPLDLSALSVVLGVVTAIEGSSAALASAFSVIGLVRLRFGVAAKYIQ